MPNTAFDPTYIANQRGEHLMTYEQLSKAAVLALVFLSGSAIARDWPTLDMHGNQYESPAHQVSGKNFKPKLWGLQARESPQS